MAKIPSLEIADEVNTQDWEMQMRDIERADVDLRWCRVGYTWECYIVGIAVILNPRYKCSGTNTRLGDTRRNHVVKVGDSGGVG